MTIDNRKPSAQNTAADKARLDAAAASAAVRRESDRSNKEAPRSRPPVPGGMRLKMAVAGEIPGYHLYWENDEDGAIEQLLYEGFEFVEAGEVRMQSAIVQDADLGNRVSRYVGKRADGSPLRAYLLKCPDEIWQERENARYEEASRLESGMHRQAEAEGRYRPKGTAIDVDNKFRKQY